MLHRLSRRTHDCIDAAAAFASQRGDHRIGTEHLLLGLVHDPQSQAVAALGVDAAAVRAELDAFDDEALASVGIETTAPSAAEPGRAALRFGSGTLTAGARSVLGRMVRRADADRARLMTPEHLTAALLDGEHPDPASDLLDRLRVDRERARTRLTGAA
jgi:ATP-dependent Clp protease ATP-binding subunit ClpA